MCCLASHDQTSRFQSTQDIKVHSSTSLAGQLRQLEGEHTWTLTINIKDQK